MRQEDTEEDEEPKLESVEFFESVSTHPDSPETTFPEVEIDDDDEDEDVESEEEWTDGS